MKHRPHIQFALTTLLVAVAASVAFESIPLDAAEPPTQKDSRDPTRLTLPDDQEAAAQVLHEWLTKRKFDCQLRTNLVLLRRDGVLMNVLPITLPNQLDRLRVIAFYHPKDEYRGTEKLAAAASDANEAQNLCQVFVDKDGDLGVGSNMTFYDEFTAQEFDAFADLFVAVVQQHVLTEDRVKLLS